MRRSILQPGPPSRMDWVSEQKTPISVDPARLKPSPEQVRPVSLDLRNTGGVVPVKLIENMMLYLPARNIVPISPIYSVTYSATTPTVIATITVPSNQVWVITDPIFFATRPNPGVVGSYAALGDYELVYFLTFELLIQGGTQVSFQQSTMADPAGLAAAVTVGRWCILNQRFGSYNTPFALYASGNSTLQIRYHIENAPTFLISIIGIRLQGFAASQTEIERITNDILGLKGSI